MPELSVTLIVLLATSLIVGIILGWSVRGGRTRSEKDAINAGWQEQLQAQRAEHQRLSEQNKSLMEQNSQYQASNKDAKMRASELSGALKEAFERRDELQRQIKEIRSDLEVAVGERNQLQSRANTSEASAAALKERDEKIFKLSRELENWQERLPPLIERFRQRNAEAERLEQELEDARARIDALESMVGSDETRVEPVDSEALGDDLDASNEPMASEPDVVGEVAELESAEAGSGALDQGDEEEFRPGNAQDEFADVETADDEDDDVEALEDQNAGDEAPAEQADDADSGRFGQRPARDNLKLIKGVGPAIEKTLNEMGIFRFNQIAEMSEYDIDRVAHRLKGFRSRIYREDWMGQARELQLRKASG